MIETRRVISGNFDPEHSEFFTNSINSLNRGYLQVDNLLKNQISVNYSVIKNFNETIQKFLVDEKALHLNIKNINIALHELNDDLALIQAKLVFFKSMRETHGVSYFSRTV